MKYTTYITFIELTANVGVDRWTVNKGAMTCTYYNKSGVENVGGKNSGSLGVACRSVKVSYLFDFSRYLIIANLISELRMVVEVSASYNLSSRDCPI